VHAARFVGPDEPPTGVQVSKLHRSSRLRLLRLRLANHPHTRVVVEMVANENVVVVVETIANRVHRKHVKHLRVVRVVIGK